MSVFSSSLFLYTLCILLFVVGLRFYQLIGFQFSICVLTLQILHSKHTHKELEDFSVHDLIWFLYEQLLFYLGLTFFVCIILLCSNQGGKGHRAVGVILLKFFFLNF